MPSEPDFYGPWPKLSQDRYEPRSPSSQVLFQVVRDHLDEFLETVSLGSDGHGLPSFVEDELRAFISCGDLRGGFARFRCRACGFERLLPFSCKGRGFCPSCISRRAAERSAHLIDHVIPPVPIRQFVLSLPVQLRYVLAWRHELCLEVLGIFADALMDFYRELARKQGIKDGKTGIISIIQRFGGSLNLNIHFHVTALDGVFYRDKKEGKLDFLEAPSLLKQQDITVLCSVVRLKVLELLKKRGFLDDSESDSFAENEPTFASMIGASATSRIATGERAGQPVLRLVTHPPNVNTRKVGRGAHIDGFDLHAGAALAGNDTESLENLLRYQLRPPLSKQRLSRLPDGRIKLRLRTPWNDGTTSLVFSPHEFLERLASLVPRPRKNLIIYHGCLAPRAKDREEIVNFGRPQTTTSAPELPLLDFERIDDDGRERKPRKYYTWSELLRRVWGADVLKCPKCDSTLKLVALVTASFAIKAILTHIGLETSPPLRSHFQEQLLLFDPAELRPRFAPASCRSPPTANETPTATSIN